MSKVRVAIVVVLLSFAPCAIATTAQTFLYLNSQPGDYIGQGIQQTFTPADGPFAAQTYSGGGLQVSFHPPDYTSSCYLDFGPPTGLKFVKAEYQGAQRSPFYSPTKPCVAVAG